jgi:hypothetical protein
VSHQHDDHGTDQVDQVNDALTRSLKACHSIIDDYRSKLAANLNDPMPANEDQRPSPDEGDTRLG